MRKNYFINPKFQSKIVFYFLGFTIATSAIFFVSNFLFIEKLLSLGTDLGLGENHIYFKFINKQTKSLYIFNSIATIVIFFGQITFGILISHKIAGPLYRLTRETAKVSEGENIQEIKHRKGDFFPEVYTAVNKLVKKKNVDSEKKAS